MKTVRMRLEHIPTLAEIEKLCFSAPWSEAALAEELDNPNAVFLVALCGGEIAGYAGMYCVAGECYLANVAVFPAFRRKGAATALLAALEEEARARNGEFLSLEVRAGNGAAIALYKKLGFAEAGRRKDFYSDPKEDGIIMTKYLSVGE